MDVSFQQLYLAARQCRQGKRKGLPCQWYEARLIDNLFATQRALHSKQWQPKPSTCFMVHNGNKPREIHAAHYADRVVHHYLVPRLERIIAPKFIYDSAANQKGKGTHFAVNRLQKMMRQYDESLKKGKAVFYMQLDVHNFFYSINKTATNLKRGKYSCKKVGWAVFLPTIKAASRWAEKIAHPTVYKLSRLKVVAK